MSDRDIIVAARRAEETGDFSEIEKIAAKMFLESARQWAPHEIQDQKCREYQKQPWWKRLFLKKPFSGALSYRAQAADDLSFATALQSAVAERNVKSFTDRR